MHPTFHELNFFFNLCLLLISISLSSFVVLLNNELTVSFLACLKETFNSIGNLRSRPQVNWIDPYQQYDNSIAIGSEKNIFAVFFVDLTAVCKLWFFNMSAWYFGNSAWSSCVSSTMDGFMKYKLIFSPRDFDKIRHAKFGTFDLPLPLSHLSQAWAAITGGTCPPNNSGRGTQTYSSPPHNNW